MERDIMTAPVTALRGLTVPPRMMVHSDISRPRPILAVEKATEGDQKVFLLTQKNLGDLDPEGEQLYHVGTLALMKQLVKVPGGTMRVLTEGMEQTELTSLASMDSALYAEVEIAPREDEGLDYIVQEAILRVLKEKLGGYDVEYPEITKEILPHMLIINDLEELTDQISVQLPWSYGVHQNILEAVFTSHQYGILIQNLIGEVQIAKAKRGFQAKVKAVADKNQGNCILRERMRIPRKGPGEDNPDSDRDKYEKQLEQLKADKETKEELKKEIRRFKTIPSGSQEANVLRTYIEILLEFPWKKMSRDDDDVRHAEQVLDKGHYRLEKVKERILEYLAAHTLTSKGSSLIICLVGSPGISKTSVARLVARALNKKYVRINLGGVRDEAEIRGHRKTYVGAMPGHLVKELRQAGVSSSLVLLDEIDKVNNDYKNDTAPVLLEVLDGEQNMKFCDHYVETPIDLSDMPLIATANTAQTIAGSLLGRMEVIEVNSYTENEKFRIAKDYLVDKQLERSGLAEKQLSISDKTLQRIIHNYTREAGIHSLERRIGDIRRKTIKEFLESGSKKSSVKVTESNPEKCLGREKISYEDANDENEIDAVRGLAWVNVGGGTLQIEANVMPGKGELKLIGQMRDVMKESAQAALTYMRSICPGHQVADDYFEKHDMHIHIPEGAVPKDRLSAGITMATTMLSVMVERPVDAKTAMIGEITLRGRVFPVGGLKEEILTVKVAHTQRVPVPEKNRADIAELPKETTKGLDIVYVENMEDVLAEALV